MAIDSFLYDMMEQDDEDAGQDARWRKPVDDDDGQRGTKEDQ